MPGGVFGVVLGVVEVDGDDVAGQAAFQGIRGALADDPPLVDDEDPVAQGVGLLQVVEALRRDFYAALDERDWRYGIAGGAPDFFRMVTESAALVARLRHMHELRERHLARVLAEETDADPDDPTPRLVAVQMVALVRAVSDEYLRRRLAGESLEAVIPAVRAAAGRAFALLESGVGDYAAKPYAVKPPARP